MEDGHMTWKDQHLNCFKESGNIYTGGGNNTNQYE